MDNLTHSFAGALLGQMGLKRLSGLSMPTLIIAANLPDIDAAAMLLGTEGLAIRRGITHGPIALLLLPLALTGIMLEWNRWRPADQPVRAGPLLLLAYIGTLSHPALDYLNSYGIRLLEPFSSRWVYGDTLFIVDVWVWAALIAGFLISRRREKSGRSDWRRPAVAAFVIVCTYIVGNGLTTARAESLAADQLRGKHPTMVVANPRPLTFWNRRMLWRNAEVHGAGEFGLFEGVRLETGVAPNNLDHPSLVASLHRPDVRALLFWSRMPIVVESGGRAFLADQRFAERLPEAAGDGTTYSYDPFTVALDSPPPSP